MPIPTSVKRLFLYTLIFLSGISGLIYEVVWHRYLAILLGAQARATAIVLAIFLGGISAGYLFFGRWSRTKKWNLFMAYSLVELGLGFWAFVFPFLFKLAMPATSHLYALLGVNSLFIDVFMSILLIGFPTFLMGGTLPLLTQALSQDLNEASRTHAKIYGFNTIGACLGCLLAGYYLIPELDLPRAVLTAGMLNTFVAFVSYMLFARHAKNQVPTPIPKVTGKIWTQFTPAQLVLLAVGFLSGFYLLTLQTVLIRLMGLATGAANYNFTLIVAIFILGLGIGSLMVKNIGNYTFGRLFWNQMCVAASMFALYLSGDYWSYWVHLIRVMFRDMPESFYVYQFGLGLVFAVVLIVPIGFAGLTLPLCFHLMKDRKETLGHRVGQLYGLNSVGCVFGALVGGYLLFNWFDLHHVFKLSVMMSLLSAALVGYIYLPQASNSTMKIMSATVVGVVTLVGVVFTPRFSHDRWVQPFRHPTPFEATFKGATAFGNYLSRSTEWLLWKDGPNTSTGIGMSRYQGKEASRTIFVNGKSDGNTRGDYFTTVMLGHVPGLLSKKLDRICVIGFGTGITAGTMTLYPDAKHIDIAEISPTSIENAYMFDSYNNNVSKNERVTFHEMDAFRFLEGTPAGYDVIISEPSNPWVAGIENLYSAEFYGIARRKLTADGIFVQWIHTYSFNDDLIKMILRTMTSEFAYTSIYQLKGGDLALVGRTKPFTKEEFQNAAKRMEVPIIKRALADAGINRLETFLGFEVVPWPLSRVIGEGAEMHRLENPKLSNEAAKAFYVGNSSKIQVLRRSYKEYYPAVEQSWLSTYLGANKLNWDVVDDFRKSYCDSPIAKSSYLCEETLAVAKLVNPGYEPSQPYDDAPPRRELSSILSYAQQMKSPFDEAELQKVYSMFEVFKKYASPVARIPLATSLSRVEYCLRVVPKTKELWGECLLQKILALETVQLPSKELYSSIDEYLNWFPTLDAKSSPNYNKLVEAKEILSKMAATQKNSTN